ncbi:neuromodulin-like [Condylostylus longicornis]|uniref:neuromodulin-like n=1 Tax=Condylostylus longicornis TaxID=2530218 RepID=UPI00244E3F2F|nr:neuromodulin-like [Condylostylus longicornis]
MEDNSDDEEAAVKIQAAFRGHKTRNEMKEKMNSANNANNNVSENFQDLDPEELEKAATKIQASYRGHRTRAELKEKKQANNNDKLKNNEDEENYQQAAVKIQAVFRGHKTRATMKNNSESSNTKESGNTATSPSAETEPTKEELEAEFDPNDKELCNAASKIQATFRGHLARKLGTTENGKLKEEDVDIQELTKKVAEELDIDLSDPDLNAAATKIQASFRGHKVRKTDGK